MTSLFARPLPLAEHHPAGTMDWDAGAVAVKDFLHDAPEAYMSHATLVDGTTPAVLPGTPGCEDMSVHGMQLRCARNTYTLRRAWC